MSSAKRRRKDEEGSHGAKFLREQIAAILAFYKGVRGESCRDVRVFGAQGHNNLVS